MAAHKLNTGGRIKKTEMENLKFYQKIPENGNGKYFCAKRKHESDET